MKRILISLVAMVFLAGTAFGTETWPLSPRLDSLAAAIHQQLGHSATGTNLLTSARVYSAINRAINATCTEFPAYEKVVQLQIYNDSLEGRWIADDFLRIKDVFRMSGDSMRIPLIPIDPDSLRQNYGSVSSNLQTTTDLMDPTYYFTFAKRFFFHPKHRDDTNTDTVLIHYFALDTKLAAAADSLNMHQEYYESVFFYACGLLTATQQKFDAANWYMSMFEKKKAPPKVREQEFKQ